jgi:TRAP transporter TAXI family solute receptor
MFGRLLVTLFAALFAAQACGPAQAQGSVSSPSAERANAGTIGVISGGADGTYIRIAADLANVLDGDVLRILPIIGRGSLQNLQDIMYLRGVDVGIVQMDAREGLTPSTLQAAAQQRLRYLARLYNEEVHVLASRDVASLRELDGKKVNIDKPGSGTNLTARLIFEKLGIKPQFTTYDQASSYERLRSGELQAAVYVAGRPVRAISEFQSDGRFHLLSIPFEGDIAETYLPARFASSDYPRLIDAGKEIETVAVGNVLAVFNWPENSERYKRVQRFVDAFFSRFDEFLQPGRHPKWKEVNLAAQVPGWTRFAPAENWLKRAVVAGGTPDANQLKSEFESFIDQLSRGGTRKAMPAAQKEALFAEFLRWRDAQPTQRQ